MLRLFILLFLPTAFALINLQQFLAWRQLPNRCRYPAYSGFNPRNPFIRLQMYYFNAESGRCELFKYSGRGGNRNRFRNPIDCLRRCACYAPMDAGSCTNSTTITRFYYNKMFRMCTTFEFTGCDGNDNNFADFMSCQLTCNRNGLDFEL